MVAAHLDLILAADAAFLVVGDVRLVELVLRELAALSRRVAFYSAVAHRVAENRTFQ